MLPATIGVQPPVTSAAHVAPDDTTEMLIAVEIEPAVLRPVIV